MNSLTTQDKNDAKNQYNPTWHLSRRTMTTRTRHKVKSTAQSSNTVSHRLLCGLRMRLLTTLIRLIAMQMHLSHSLFSPPPNWILSSKPPFYEIFIPLLTHIYVNICCIYVMRESGFYLFGFYYRPNRLKSGLLSLPFFEPYRLRVFFFLKKAIFLIRPNCSSN